jgi:hypothetical protein
MQVRDNRRREAARAEPRRAGASTEHDAHHRCRSLASLAAREGGG